MYYHAFTLIILYEEELLALLSNSIPIWLSLLKKRLNALLCIWLLSNIRQHFYRILQILSIAK